MKVYTHGSQTSQSQEHFMVLKYIENPKAISLVSIQIYHIRN